MRLSQIALQIEALHQGPDVEIEGACAIDVPDFCNKIAPLLDFCWQKSAPSSKAAAFLVSDLLRPILPATCACLVVPHSRARDCWGQLLRLLYPEPPLHLPVNSSPTSIDVTAYVDPLAHVGAFVYVGPQAVIESGVVLHPGVYIGARAKIGARSTLFPGAVIWDDVVMGSDCQIGAHAVIGGPGFGLDARGNLPHVGDVILEDHVRIGACCCIDRATLSHTQIDRGAQLDNLIQIGHNVHIGAGAVLCGQSGVAGHAQIGAGVQIGGQAGVSNGVELEPGVRLAAQSCATKKLSSGMTYSGNPAEPHRSRLRFIAQLRKMVRGK